MRYINVRYLLTYLLISLWVLYVAMTTTTLKASHPWLGNGGFPLQILPVEILSYVSNGFDSIPVLVTGVSPLPAPGSGTAYLLICDGQTLSLANSVDTTEPETQI